VAAPLRIEWTPMSLGSIPSRWIAVAFFRENMIIKKRPESTALRTARKKRSLWIWGDVARYRGNGRLNDAHLNRINRIYRLNLTESFTGRG
jgi:hypothetical protein